MTENYETIELFKNGGIFERYLTDAENEKQTTNQSTNQQ